MLRRHRAADLLSLPDFLAPKAPVESPPPKIAAVQEPTPSWATSAPATRAATNAAPRTLICAHCGAKISYPEGKFCWNNEKRFGGLQYCRDHQGLFK